MQTNQALENEMSVIGAILLDNEAIESVLPVLKVNDFTDSRHRVIYSAIIKLANDGAPVDLVTVTMALREADQIEKIGDDSYLSDLVDFVPTAANVSHYAKQVRKASTRRNLEAQFGEAIRKLQHGEDVTSVCNYIDSARLDQTMDRKGEPTHISLDLIRTIENIEAAQKNPGKINGLETHFGKFDRLTGGLRGGDLIIMAGRPAMGKTALALNMAEQCSIRGKAVAFFSLEMSRAQLVERLMLGSAGVDSGRARVGKLEGKDFNQIIGAAETLHKASLMVDDTGGLSIPELRTRCMRLKRRSGLDLVVIDYLQLMKGEGDNRTQEVGSISRALKTLAKELDVPIIALAQLSRAVEQRTSRRPNLSDLRDSGEIEQDADLVCFLYRDIVYNAKADPREAELIIAKHRRGPLASIPLCFDAIYTRFAA